MSFSVEFTAAHPADARKIVEQEYLPDPVKAFLTQALTVIPEESPVYVKAIGHLPANEKEYLISSADIKVQACSYRAPRAEEPQAAEPSAG